MSDYSGCSRAKMLSFLLKALNLPTTAYEYIVKLRKVSVQDDVRKCADFSSWLRWQKESGGEPPPSILLRVVACAQIEAPEDVVVSKDLSLKKLDDASGYHPGCILEELESKLHYCTDWSLTSIDELETLTDIAWLIRYLQLRTA